MLLQVSLLKLLKRGGCRDRRGRAEPGDLGAFLWIGLEPVLCRNLMDSLGAGRLHFLRALSLLATLACLGSHVIRAGANDVLHSGLTVLNAASSGQGETDNLGSVAPICRIGFLTADLRSAFGSSRLDLPG